MRTNILEVLKDEHVEIIQLLNRIMRSDEIDEKKKYYHEMKQKLYAHMEAEELTLYASLKSQSNENAQSLADDAEFEHRQVRDSFEMLEGMEFNSAEWSEFFEEIKINLEEHVEFEESILFAEAKEDFSVGQLLHFTKNYLETKDRTIST